MNKDKQNEPEIEELSGVDATPPLTDAELKELGKLIGEYDKQKKEDKAAEPKGR